MSGEADALVQMLRNQVAMMHVLASAGLGMPHHYVVLKREIEMSTAIIDRLEAEPKG